MKYISTAIDPNGNIPEIIISGKFLKYQGCWGICLGIWLVLTGMANKDFLDANIDPTTDKGIEITNHIVVIANIVPIGIAPEDST